MSADLGTFDVDGIRRAYDNIEKPKGQLSKILNAVVTDVSANTKVSLTGIKAWLRGISRDKALQAAALKWIQPGDPHPIDMLPLVQEQFGFEKEDSKQFVSILRQECWELTKKCPALSRHIQARIADLDFVLNGQPLRSARAGDFAALQETLLLQSRLGPSSQPQEPCDLVGAAQDALANVAREVAAVLSPDGNEATVSANLMVRLPNIQEVSSLPQALGPLSALRASQTAETIWEGLTGSCHGVWVVVGETRASAYRGFWLPDVRRKGKTIPGAPAAAYTSNAQAVFVDDLPPFPIDDNVVFARWVKYLSGEQTEHFVGKLFLSLPVFSKSGDERQVAGVININVNQEWPRAYSKYWLQAAEGQAMPWLSTSWFAWALSYEANPWKTLGIAGTASALPPAPEYLPSFVERQILGMVLSGRSSTALLPYDGGDSDDD